MIRIDEIYNHTFWPWIQKELPLTRLFFCDPPGRSDPNSLQNFGHDVIEQHYIFLHDQEPIHLDLHAALFDDVVYRNRDLNHTAGPKKCAIITSERDSAYVEHVCNKYGWTPFYYFYHGWAALDWYRGYDKTFLIQPYKDRKIVSSFISPNRIVGGKRDHRVLLMYYLLKENVSNALISFPETCPAEEQSVVGIAQRFTSTHSDIQSVFSAANLPWNFPNETGHPMHSCWLSLFDECAQSLAFVVTETVFYNRRHHLTEKTFKPICMSMPFVMVSSAGSLEYLRSYGFKTFDSLWDESYDLETNDDVRLKKIADLLIQLDRMSQQELQELHTRAQPIVQHNFEHFYNGGFEKILWDEFNNMLSNMQAHWEAK